MIQKLKFESELKELNHKTTSNSSEVISYNNEINQANRRIDVLEENVSYFRGKNYFEDDATQNYSVFEPVYRCFKRVIYSTNNTFYAHCWQSKGLSDEKINAPGISSSNNNNFRIEWC